MVHLTRQHNGIFAIRRRLYTTIHIEPERYQQGMSNLLSVLWQHVRVVMTLKQSVCSMLL